MSNDNSNDTSDHDSRRSIMKKGALATGALALGAGATANSASIGGPSNAASVQDGADLQGEMGLVYAYQFYPNTDFTVVEQLRQGTTVQLLQPDGEAPDVIGDVADWRGHIIRYEIGDGSGINTLLFLREQTMSQGDSSTTGSDAQMYSSELNLLATTLGGDGGEAPEEEEEAPEEEEPADNETEPADNETEAADNETEPADNETEPADNETEPADNETEPADNETEPADNETEPADTETEGENGLQIDVALNNGENESGYF